MNALTHVERQMATAPLTDYVSEQALLAALLVNGSVLPKVRDFLLPDHFADALHARIYDAVCRLVDATGRCDLSRLSAMLRDDIAFDEPGRVTRYMVDLMRNVVTIYGAEDFGVHVHDLAMRREAARRLDDARDALMDPVQPLGEIVGTTKGALTDVLAGLPTASSAIRAAEDYASEVVELYEGRRAPKFSTGWASIDPLYQVRGGELTIVTGYPSAGKSEWLDALCINLAIAHSWRFALCSFENPPKEHLAKLAEKYARKPFYPGPQERMTRTDLDLAMDWIGAHFKLLRAEADEAPTIDWILRGAVSAVREHGIKGLVIDPYNEIDHKRPGGQPETEYVSAMLRKVKRFAVDHGVHVWFVAHPTKPQRNKDGTVAPLSLYDISGGANWNNKADVGIVVERAVEEGSRDVHIHVRKVRFKAVGQRGSATLEFDRATGRYSEKATVALPYGQQGDGL